MAEMTRNCPDCGHDLPFEQVHAGPGDCPDAPDGVCPEWLCSSCGAALLIGLIELSFEPAAYDSARARVA
ncbi:MAG: hypothetical protein ACLPN6_13360 [Streptosporangiaceae bacterium]|jgi:hypothetical protein